MPDADLTPVAEVCRYSPQHMMDGVPATTSVYTTVLDGARGRAVLPGLQRPVRPARAGQACNAAREPLRRRLPRWPGRRRNAPTGTGLALIASSTVGNPAGAPGWTRRVAEGITGRGAWRARSWPAARCITNRAAPGRSTAAPPW